MKLSVYQDVYISREVYIGKSMSSLLSFNARDGATPISHTHVSKQVGVSLLPVQHLPEL